MHSLLPYPVAEIGTLVVLALAWLLLTLGGKIIDSQHLDVREHYRRRKMLSTVVVVLAVLVLLALWSHPLRRTSTFLGLMAAGVAIALKEPLLSIAGRIAIFVGHIYDVGDRIEIDKMKGDVIDIGFFYTRMMEVGAWINADQASGRIVQMANAEVFGHPVFNYTRNFSFIWDEVNLPITYNSNLRAAQEILVRTGREYTREFLQGAQRELQQMQRYFMVQKLELEPIVYLRVTSNWLQLNMRYVVDPKRRRDASNFLYNAIFADIQQRDDISIGSTTMDLAVHGPAFKNTPHDEEQQSPTQQPGSEAA